MIKTLRIRFIITVMVLVLVIISVLIGAINIINYKRVTDNADDILQILSYNDGIFAPDFKPVPEKPSEESSSSTEASGDDVSSEESSTEEDKIPPTPDHITIETPFETRYFSVKFSKLGAVANTEHIASISEPNAISMATEVLKGGDENGYYNSYRYMVIKEKSLVIFIDWTRQLETASNFLFASILTAICVVIVILGITLLLSARAVAPIAEGYERQRRFIADASHELKTPLTIISANNELIEMTQGETEYSASISKQVVRMTNMVKNLSSLASINDASKHSKDDTFSLSAVCKELCELFEPVLTRGSRTFKHSIDSGIDFYGDESLIRLLISNLLENAGKYAISHTELSLSIVGKRAQLIVSNDATSVENGSLKRCFERFYRSDEARASGIEGSGIGLCVAEEIVTLHGGQISAYGIDNTFNIKVIL